MATTKEYNVPMAQAVNAVVAAITQLGYPAETLDRQNGFVKFKAQQMHVTCDMTAQLVEPIPGTTKILVSSTGQTDGGLLGANAGDKVAKKVFDEIDKTLGAGKEVATASGGCFIATAVYGDYAHPNVLLFRSFRDEVLLQSPLGTAFVSAYYKCGPRLAMIPQNSSTVRVVLRRLFDRLASLLR